MKILAAHAQGISEFDLIKSLTEAGVEWPKQNESAELVLFQKHFITMHALYSLQDTLFEESIYLEVSAIKIRLQLSNSLSSGLVDFSNLVASTDAQLKAFYLDWGNYKGTGADEVNTLLNQFWCKYASWDKQSESLEVLGVSSDASRSEIDTAYRRLAAKHHPDKGGAAEAFIQIRQAYEILIEKVSRRAV